MADLVETIKLMLRDVSAFSRCAGGIRLRQYQQEVARAVVGSVLQGRGLSMAVMFPRQSGKNELQAQIEAYLLTLLSQTPAEIVKVSPTLEPQARIAMRRLERVLGENLLCRDIWRKEQGNIYRVGQARIIFLSAAPEAHITGATAATLLEVDEAQDVTIAKFDRDVAPMAASTNATRVFWGTAWTSQTLLAREFRQAQEAEQADGLRRAFALTADEVGAEVPAYRAHVAAQVARLGRSHPMVRTQYFGELIDEQAGMFPPERLALMVGTHPRQPNPPAGLPRGRNIAFLLDVGGEASLRAGGEANGRRDATALTIVEVDASRASDPAVGGPVYRVLDRRRWTGENHNRLLAGIRALAENWRARALVVDATGVGAGLASFLEKALPGRVTPFVFSAASKSRLGWGFLAVVETGRYREYAPQDDLQALFWREARLCRASVFPGPEKRMAWGVPDGTRDPADGTPVHDDLLLSAALVAELERMEWGGASTGALVVPGRDPLAEIEGF